MTNLPDTEELVDAIYEFAAEQMNAKVPHDEIQKSLVERGLDHETAAAVVRNLLLAHSGAVKTQGKSNMIYGAIWCAAGIVVLYLRSGAVNSGFFTFLIWAAIIFGAYNFFRGIFQLAG